MYFALLKQVDLSYKATSLEVSGETNINSGNVSFHWDYCLSSHLALLSPFLPVNNRNALFPLDLMSCIWPMPPFTTNLELAPLSTSGHFLYHSSSVSSLSPPLSAIPDY
ncbi:hypothetical protein H112_08928 [Trichophyton rubrum D6]|uniref:Uncharacterized protein n=3 Tax=Trichophyton TaxID=5550 RepID=A0A080WKQ0_TRIRC|nr:uncharacterized protein TERG_11719 [Trichophyton rubrum CBS 118892]EZF09634.1 hypothetical protein H100_08950 [Trichophyton rubrum MR850]EZF36560.1 hypothetical protein H102_08908 [Trichophyton rubrum CBS 100081]EZF47142.1 hypothetical protein H103_08932 [Trichophyton rubrum CBS 288.86]EZF57824.1 hypothetical protein H104_08880 [Trichophyton rubrum CBS 289.86]EZF68410.1 hypothetical protein H105_08935 [Trichophyton soudanense CBS 452.61]EZF79113.1 hypothetical protein H110_08931 [Trichophy